MKRARLPRRRAGAALVSGVSLAALLMAAASCGRGANEGSAVKADPYPQGYCRITVAGAVTKDEVASNIANGTGAATVYWMTDESLRSYFEWKFREVDKKAVAPEDVNFLVDQSMARNPRFTPLMIKCWAPAVSVSLVPGFGSRYENIPFRPASYTIAPASQVRQTIPGYFAAQTTMVDNGKGLDFTPVGHGQLIVTLFDDARVGGTFAYEAASGKLRVSVKGVFEFKRAAQARALHSTSAQPGGAPIPAARPGDGGPARR
jgi:hypothetical protein